MKVLIIWDHHDDELFGVALANDDEVNEAEQELKSLIEPDTGLEVYPYTPETREALLAALKEFNT